MAKLSIGCRGRYSPLEKGRAEMLNDDFAIASDEASGDGLSQFFVMLCGRRRGGEPGPSEILTFVTEMVIHS